MSADLDRPPVAGRTARAAAWWHARAPWEQALLVYAVTRLWGLFLLTRAGLHQAESVWTGPDPSYFDMTDNWDGIWYRTIAEQGYPADVPRDDGGRAFQNPWAFYPLFPFLARALMTLTGLDFAPVASTLALLLGAAAVVVLRSVVEHVAGRGLALWTVVLVCAFPSAVALQLAYTESIALLLLCCLLWCLQRGRYGLAVPVVLLIGVARPIGVPVAAVVALHLLRPWLPARVLGVPTGGGGPRPEGAALAVRGALLAAAGAAAFAWPVLAALATGERQAYTDTMAAWRGSAQIEPFRPWWGTAQFYAGDVAGPLLLLAAAAVLAWALTRPVARVVAGDLRAWAGFYLLYLVAVLDPGTSLPRYLLLAFPLGTLTAAVARDRAYRVAVTVAFLAGQVVWVVWLWRFVPPSDLPP